MFFRKAEHQTRQLILAHGVRFLGVQVNQPFGVRCQCFFPFRTAGMCRAVDDVRSQHSKANELQNAALNRTKNRFNITVESPFCVSCRRPPVVRESIAWRPRKTPS
jgi:hypothetical protein